MTVKVIEYNDSWENEYFWEEVENMLPLITRTLNIPNTDTYKIGGKHYKVFRTKYDFNTDIKYVVVNKL